MYFTRPHPIRAGHTNYNGLARRRQFEESATTVGGCAESIFSDAVWYAGTDPLGVSAIADVTQGGATAG